jgi:hypothetical protein
VLRRNRQLLQVILWARLPISKIANARVITSMPHPRVMRRSTLALRQRETVSGTSIFALCTISVQRNQQQVFHRGGWRYRSDAARHPVGGALRSKLPLAAD